MTSTNERNSSLQGPSKMAMASDKGQKRTRKRAKKEIDEWEDVEELLSNPDGIIANMDLKKLLSSPAAFDLLSASDKEKLFTLARPQDVQTDEDGNRSFKPSFLKSSEFTSAIALYKDDLRQGRHDPEWLREALVAHEARKEGKFERYERAQLKKDWGIDVTDIASHTK